jgi:myosin heavy subunit
MTSLSQTTPFYVRCIKPNAMQQAFTFEEKLVTEQLIYLGLLETVKIRQKGWPSRLQFEEFSKR